MSPQDNSPIEEGEEGLSMTEKTRRSPKGKKHKQGFVVAIGSDHAGYALKEEIKRYLVELGYSYEDFGTMSEESVDYPIFGAHIAESVSNGECKRGILICATGIGMSIVANKIFGVRAALCHSVETTRLAREHNDANILVMGSKIVGPELAKEMVKCFLNSGHLAGRHARRVNRIIEIEMEEIHKAIMGL
jgi:ribose 5-phosphate isomerase B